MSELVTYAVDGDVAVLTLNDPSQRNALSPEMQDALLAALAHLRSEPAPRCAILTGAGAAFSAGGNPKRMLEPGLYPDMSPEQLVRFYQSTFQRLPLAIEAVEIPLIAAVNGPAIGAGCDLVAMCDLRIAADTANFASSFVKLGLAPGDGGAWILPRAIGEANAGEMMLTGDLYDANAALRMGLVSRVSPSPQLMDDAMQLARRIGANSPIAVRQVKRLMRDCRTIALPEALRLSALAQAALHKTHDHREAVEAFLEKRDPQFTGS